METKPKKAYMCLDDFVTEMGESRVMLYSSLDSMEAHTKCPRYCTIIEVEVSCVKVISEPKEYTDYENKED